MTTRDRKSGARRETRRDQQKRETREVIRRAARWLFDAKGYESTTIRAIASKAGVGIGTVHLHFHDKESLLMECLIDDLAENDRRSWESMPKDVPVKEQLLHLARGGFSGWNRRPSLSRILLRQTVLSGRPELDRLRTLDRGVFDRVTALLTAAQKRGEVRPDVDASLATNAIFSFYLTASLGWLGGKPGVEAGESSDTDPALSEEGLEALVEEAGRFLDQFFQGIGTTEGESG